MPARDQILNAAGRLLPQSLTGVGAGSAEELSARFLETTEMLVLDLLLNPESQYHLAHLICLKAQEELRTVLAAADSILKVLEAEPGFQPPPVVDRNRQLSSDYLQRIRSSLAAGRVPSSEDVSAYENLSRQFASAQLVPHDQNYTPERMRLEFVKSVQRIEGVLAELRQRLEALRPSSFFVDRLVPVLLSSPQMGLSVDRLKRIEESQNKALSSGDYSSRTEMAPAMLAEVASVNAMVKLFSRVSSNATRYLIEDVVSPVYQESGVTYGEGKHAELISVPATNTYLDGVRYFVSDSDDPEIELMVNGNPLTIALPSVTRPVPITIRPPANALDIENGRATITLACNKQKDGVMNSYVFRGTIIPSVADNTVRAALTGVPAGYTVYQESTSDYWISAAGSPPGATASWSNAGSSLAPTWEWFTAQISWEPPAPTSANKDFVPRTTVHADGNVALNVSDVFDLSVEWKIGLLSGQGRVTGPDTRLTVGFSPSDWHTMHFTDATAVSLGDEVLLSVASTEGLRAGQYALVDGGINDGIYTIVAVVDGTYVRVVPQPAPESSIVVCFRDHPASDLVSTFGGSPSLQEVADAIYVGNVVSAELDQDLRIVIRSDVVGVTDGIPSTLEVVSQPQLTLHGETVDALGIPPYGAGTCTSLKFSSVDLGILPLLRNYVLVSDVLSGAVRRVLSRSVLELENPFDADLGSFTARVYTRGGWSYEQGIEALSALYDQYLDDLLESTDRLRDLLGRSVLDENTRIEAKEYVLRRAGSLLLKKGPAYELLQILASFTAPASESFGSAVKLLRERGFDLCVDLLLLGDVDGALRTDGASYSTSMRDAAVLAGLEGF